MDKYEDEVETGMMKGYAKKEKDHLIPNVLAEVNGKAKANALEKVIQETMHEAIAKPKKYKWFDIFKSK